MCGRMAITLLHNVMSETFAASTANDLPHVPNYNVCPTDQVVVIISTGGTRQYRPMRWGFIPHWYKMKNDGLLLINARAETVAENQHLWQYTGPNAASFPRWGFMDGLR
ncbi:MAG: putative SOS response-associated peptidase YedK [Alteromonas macleodii]|jgi:putative SOS response-associated peptidase YedK